MFHQRQAGPSKTEWMGRRVGRAGGEGAQCNRERSPPPPAVLGFCVITSARMLSTCELFAPFSLFCSGKSRGQIKHGGEGRTKERRRAQKRVVKWYHRDSVRAKQGGPGGSRMKARAARYPERGLLIVTGETAAPLRPFGGSSRAQSRTNKHRHTHTTTAPCEYLAQKHAESEFLGADPWIPYLPYQHTLVPRGMCCRPHYPCVRPQILG